MHRMTKIVLAAATLTVFAAAAAPSFAETTTAEPTAEGDAHHPGDVPDQSQGTTGPNPAMGPGMIMCPMMGSGMMGGMMQGMGPGMMGPGMMQGYGPGMGQGYGPGMMGGMMGQGMMGPGMMGPGMMGPGMMQGYGPGMMGQGYAPGMGQGYGQGMMGGGGMRPMFAMIDENGDGLVNPDEAASRQESVFAAMDADADGFATQEEHDAAHGGMGPGMGMMGMGAGQGMQASPMLQQMLERRAERFKAMDTDADGRVSQAEFMAAGQARFAEADLDKDGKVTVWEFRTHRR
jgi:hypothetical protein